MHVQPLILTLRLDEASFATFDQLRRQHFPAERNFIAAHVTLFHALPGEQAELLIDTLNRTCAQAMPFAVAFPRLRPLGRGVAAEVAAPELLQLRAALARAWDSLLGPQDRQAYRPHITIQNKVDTQTARVLLEQLSAFWQQPAGQATGLQLWRYQGGPWAFVEDFAFATQPTQAG